MFDPRHSNWTGRTPRTLSDAYGVYNDPIERYRRPSYGKWAAFVILGVVLCAAFFL